MSAFYSFEVLDPYSHLLSRHPIFTNPTLSSSFHSPLAHAVESADDYLDFKFDILYPSSTPVDLPRPYFLHPHHHCYHHYRTPPLLPRSLEFFDAAADLICHEHAEAELYARDLGDRLAALELGLDRMLGPCIGAPERKWKWTAHIKGTKGEAFDRKFKCTAETKGAFENMMKWTVEYQGKGNYAPLSRMSYTFRAASAPPLDVWEKAKKEKKVKRAVKRHVEIDEGKDQQVVSRRQALAKRTVHRSKGKKKELSQQDAAIAIQKTFRDHMSRRSRALQCLRDLAVAKSKLKEIRALFTNFSYRYRMANDSEERQRFSEKIIILLLTVDAIEGPDFMVRSAKRSMTHELEAVLEVVDPQPSRELGSRRRRFDLPDGSFATEMASGVADIVNMLDQEDGGRSILPDLSL